MIRSTATAEPGAFRIRWTAATMFLSTSWLVVQTIVVRFPLAYAAPLRAPSRVA